MFKKGEKIMKKTIVNLSLAVTFLMACIPAPLLADGPISRPPYCPPDCICN
jgi:hypothetical protein